MAAKKIMRHASGLKAHRKSLVRQAQNVQVRSRIRTLASKVIKAVQEKNAAVAKEAFIVAQGAWKKAANSHVVHKNAASRTISRLATRIATLAKN